MYTVEKLLQSHGIKTNTINTPKGKLVMADNEDGTVTPFKIDVELKEVYKFLGQ